MEDRDIPPTQVRKVNAAVNHDLIESLVESMKKDGWTGRPLLVEEVCRYERYTQYFAWTGSHRIEAAKRAGLSSVPCMVTTHKEADSAFSGAGYDQYGFSSWRGAVSSAEGPLDEHRLRGLERAGLQEAAQMLREELAA